MKRILSLIIASLLLIVVLAACDKADGEETTTKETTSETTSPETTPNSSDTTESTAESTTEADNIPNDTPVGEIPTRIIEDYDEYIAYISSVDIPSDFIHYGALSSIGEFEGFFFIPTRALSLGNYAYYLKDSTGNVFFLDIDPWTEEDENRLSTVKLVTSSFTATDMRKLGSSETASVLHNGIRFSYSKGELHLIEWHHDSIRYRLSVRGEDRWNGYPANTTNTFVGKLLNLNTATSEIQNFNTKVQK
jgi:hypothetical protein